MALSGGKIEDGEVESKSRVAFTQIYERCVLKMKNGEMNEEGICVCVCVC